MRARRGAGHIADHGSSGNHCPCGPAATTAPAASAATTAPAAAAATTAPAAAEGSWWATAAKDAGCVGKTIRGVSESTPPSKFAADPIGKEFTKETGINVEFETTSWDQMYDKAIKDMEANTGIYDFVYIEQDIIYSTWPRTTWSTSPRR